MIVGDLGRGGPEVIGQCSSQDRDARVSLSCCKAETGFEMRQATFESLQARRFSVLARHSWKVSCLAITGMEILLRTRK